VTCFSDDPELQQHFLQIAGPVLTLLGSSPSCAEIASTIGRFIELFRAITALPRKSVRGLWAELFVMARALGTRELVRAWHTQPEDRYDFCAGSQRIEVKSAAGPPRTHHFSLEQLHAPVGCRVVIASLFVERAGAGSSVGELFNQVRATVADDPELLLHLERTARLALGSGWQQALQERFDWERAYETLEFYDAAAIPSLGPAVPAGVTQVHFVSDLTRVAPVDRAQRRSAGGLFRAVQSRQAERSRDL
jgi:hypothetical protein